MWLEKRTRVVPRLAPANIFSIGKAVRVYSKILKATIQFTENKLEKTN